MRGSKAQEDGGKDVGDMAGLKTTRIFGVQELQGVPEGWNFYPKP